MTSKLLKDVSASTLQVLINQSLGAVVFLVTSFYLPKESYGELNWSFAIFTFMNNLLSLRLEQIVVKKAATDSDSSKIMTLFMLHVFLSGAGFYAVLLLLSLAFPAFFSVHNLLLIVGLSQLFSFFSSPFKQVANGKERFDWLAAMSSVNNVVRVLLLLVLIFFSELTIGRVLIIFIAGSVAELLFCFLVARFRMQVRVHAIRFRDYALLLKESLPQMGTAVLLAGITRFDWIFLGIFSTTIVTAEYSFAYRVYELSPFPLLIIAPVLLSRFSRYFANDPQRSLLERRRELSLLIRAEMIVATFIPLVLNIIWVPAIDALTGNKYGKVNEWTFFVLSLCIPFQYISNIIWSTHFAQNRLKLILKITLITFLIVLVGDSVFILRYGALGAATVYLTAMIIEYINFMRYSEIARIKESWQSLLVCLFAGAISGFGGVYFFEDIALRLVFALALFFLAIWATGQWRKSDTSYVIQLVRRRNKS